MKTKSIFLTLFTMIFSLYAEMDSYEEIIDQNKLEVRTPSLACRKTAKIRLNNGLEALLISDPEVSQSAAALSMEVGSWSDPIEYPGMAHFTEHLLFLASKTYPEENGYFKQVSNNGGSLNAYTASDHTVYMFTVNHNAFSPTLEYFSHMFIDPLFSQSGVERELHAVDQEHDKNIENDSFREYMILKTTGNQNHPNSHFATGNAQTLNGIPRETVIQWYQENYSSDKAHLIIYAALPIEELKQLTVANFSKIPCISNKKNDFPEKLTTSSNQSSITYITPVQELRELTVFWELPNHFFLDLEDTSDALLAYILNSRHPESLYSKLKNEELIDFLSAGSVSLSKNSGFFCIEFKLTPKGLIKSDRIIESLFQTLATMKEQGIPKYIFDETKNMAKIDYEYQSRTDPFHYVMTIAAQMIREPLETFPQRLALPAEYNIKKCNQLLQYLQPKTAQYHIKALPEESGVIPDQKEQWSGAEYKTVPIEEKTLTNWEQVRAESESIYPQKNSFIPENLKLVTNKKIAKDTPIPELISDNEYGQVYYWEDDRYLIPEVSWILSFKSPYLNRSSKQITLISLFEKCLYEHLISTAYYAQAASLSNSIGDKDYKFIIHINGFSEKAPLLLEEVLEGIKTCNWTKEEFALQQSLLITDYENFQKMPPLTQGCDLLNNVLFDIYPRQNEQLETLRTLTYEDFQNFKEKFLEQAYAEMMLTGNLTKEDAYAIWNTVQNHLRYLPYSKELHLERNFLSLPLNHGPYKLYEKVGSLGHGALLVLQEGPFSFKKTALTTILSKGLSEDFFDTLRTKQQTAYIARSMNMEEEGQLFQVFCVQSSTHQPDELIARFELFLEDYVYNLEAKIPEGMFENIRANLITTAQQPPENLSSMSSHLYTLAFKHKDFQYVNKKIEALANLDYEFFKKEAASFLSRDNLKRIAIIIEGNPPEGKNFQYQNITADELKKNGSYVTWTSN